MQWIRLEHESDIPQFMDAALQMHLSLFSLLSREDRPYFFDAWLHRFNHSSAWRLADRERSLALVTVPRLADTHCYRWQVRTLACLDEAAVGLRLPDEIDLSRSFTMPVSSIGTEQAQPIIAGTTQKPVGYGYVCRLDEVKDRPTEKWTFRPMERTDLGAILELLRVGYATAELPEPELERQRFEVFQIEEHHAGWCFVASEPGAVEPIGVVSYTVLQIPLIGVPAALVGDLAVHPEHRGRGLARCLQRWAAAHLRAAGLRWVFGNIDPDNPASRRQAEALGRRMWYQAVRFYE